MNLFGIIGTIAGGIIGSFFGAPWIGMAIGGMAGGFVGNIISPQEGETIRGPRLDTPFWFNSVYGRPLPVVYGKGRCQGSVIWTEGIKETEIIEEIEIETGGGIFGFGGSTVKQTQVHYKYTCSFAVAFCKGEADVILKLWADAHLIKNVSGSNENVTAIEGLKINTHIGTTTQTADDVIVAVEGTGNVPGYRDTVYIVFENFDLQKFGNRVPNVSAEIVMSGSVNYNHDEISGFYDYESSTKPRITTDAIAIDTERRRVYVMGGFDIAVVDIDNKRVINYRTLDEERVFVAVHPVTGDLYVIAEDMLYRLNKDSLATVASVDLGLVSGDHVVCTKEGVWITYSSTAAPHTKIFRYDNDCVLVGEIDLDDYYDTEIEIVNVSVDSAGNAYFLIHYDLPGSRKVDLMEISPAFEIKHLISRLDTTAGSTPQILYYDETEDCCICGYDADGGNDLVKVDMLDDSVTTLAAGTNRMGAFAVSAITQGAINGKLFYTGAPTTSDIVELDIKNFTITSYDHDLWDAVDIENLEGSVYDPVSDSIICMEDRATHTILQLYFHRYDTATVDLQTVVEDICIKVGLGGLGTGASLIADTGGTGIADTAGGAIADTAGPAVVSEFADASDLSGVAVNGFVVDRVVPARSTIEDLRKAYFFDAMESDGKIKFILKGNASAATIGEDDLAAHEAGSDMGIIAEIQRIQELELPAKVNVSYVDINAEYERGLQHAERITTESDNILNLNLPIGLTEDEGKQIALKTRDTVWTERLQYSFAYNFNYLKFDPTDVITLTIDNDSHLVRLTKIQIDFPSMIQCQALLEDLSGAIYSSTETGSGSTFPIDGVLYEGISDLVFLDIPILTDGHNNAGFYFGVIGHGNGWRTALIYQKVYREWSLIQTVVNRLTYGYSLDVLADHTRGNVRDTSGTVTVFMGNGTLSSAGSYLDLCNGANLAILGDEILQFQTVVDNGDGTYTLSSLLRGRYGTEQHIAGHAVGDQFILLDADSIYRQTQYLADLNTAFDYKAVSLNKTLAGTVAESFTNTGAGLECWSPVDIVAARDGSDNITLTWKRRNRIDFEWTDTEDIPMSESSESYEVDILDHEGNVVRGIVSLTSETASYSNADQQTDFDDLWVVGKNTIGSTENVTCAADRRHVTLFTTTEDYEYIEKLWFYAVDAEGGAAVKAVIYNSLDGEPSSLLAVSGELSGVAEGWNACTFGSEISLEAGTYFIGIIPDTLIKTTGNSGTGTSRYQDDDYADGPDDVFGASSSSSYQRPFYLAEKYPTRVSVNVYQISGE